MDIDSLVEDVSGKKLAGGGSAGGNKTWVVSILSSERKPKHIKKEIELGLGIPAETAKKQTMEEIKRWRQKR